MPVLCVDKPLGLTSHDVVARARRLLSTKKVGHAGTLDPLATGVLLVLVGESTKLSPYLTGRDKSYLAWVTFGAGTPTLDAEGPITDRGDTDSVDTANLESALAGFLTVTEQRPPAFSAIKQAGQRSYAAARRGELEEPPARPVTYHRAALLALAPSRDQLPTSFAPMKSGTAVEWLPQPLPEPGGRTFTLPERLDVDDALPTALIAVTVSAGTYVRSLARDLGSALGTFAHLSGLVRVASGTIDLSGSVPVDDIATAVPVPATKALGLPMLPVGEQVAVALRQGKHPALPVAARTAVVDAEDELVAIVEPADGDSAYRLMRVFN